MDWIEIITQVLAVLGMWAHANPWLKNASNNKKINGALRVGNLLAGEYRHNRSAE